MGQQKCWLNAVEAKHWVRFGSRYGELLINLSSNHYKLLVSIFFVS